MCARRGVGTPSGRIKLDVTQFCPVKLPCSLFCANCVMAADFGVKARAGTVAAEEGVQRAELSAGKAYGAFMALMFNGATTGAVTLPCTDCAGSAVSCTLFATPGEIASTSMEALATELLERHCDADAGATQSVPG